MILAVVELDTGMAYLDLNILPQEITWQQR